MRVGFVIFCEGCSTLIKVSGSNPEDGRMGVGFVDGLPDGAKGIGGTGTGTV